LDSSRGACLNLELLLSSAKGLDCFDYDPALRHAPSATTCEAVGEAYSLIRLRASPARSAAPALEAEEIMTTDGRHFTAPKLLHRPAVTLI
jgi:hypothetical protein